MSKLADATRIARLFHYNYERLAPRFAYSTRPESAVPWEDVPQANRDLMVAVVETLLDRGVIEPGPIGDGQSQTALADDKDQAQDSTVVAESRTQEGAT